MTKPTRRVLAVASYGGHWIQLMRLRRSLADAQPTFVSTDVSAKADVSGHHFYSVVDANRSTKLRLFVQLIQTVWILARVRPHAVVSTGATVGFFACRVAKLMGARVIWVDSIANADELSASGRRVGAFADVWLTQWEHLARPSGPYYKGSVL